MCRMIAAPGGIPGAVLLPGFLRMAQGRNTVNEKNRTLGHVQHADGWGALYMQEGRVFRYRSTKPCWEDKALARLDDVDVLALHARRATQGAVADSENVHPFVLQTEQGLFHFMHNGTVRDPLTVERKLRGHTDSEKYFVWLVEALEHASFDERALSSAVNALQDYSALNGLLLRERTLWTICKAREPSSYFTLHWQMTAWGNVVSSEPLAELAAEWNGLENGSIARFDAHTGPCMLSD